MTRWRRWHIPTGTPAGVAADLLGKTGSAPSASSTAIGNPDYFRTIASTTARRKLCPVRCRRIAHRSRNDRARNRQTEKKVCEAGIMSPITVLGPGSFPVRIVLVNVLVAVANRLVLRHLRHRHRLLPG